MQISIENKSAMALYVVGVINNCLPGQTLCIINSNLCTSFACSGTSLSVHQQYDFKSYSSQFLLMAAVLV